MTTIDTKPLDLIVWGIERANGTLLSPVGIPLLWRHETAAAEFVGAGATERPVRLRITRADEPAAPSPAEPPKLESTTGLFAPHRCDGFARHDMGATNAKAMHYSDYVKHYGEDGFEVEWVDDPRAHDGLMAAYAKNQEAAKRAKESSDA